METLCRLSYRGNERNLKQIRFAVAIRFRVASLTAARPVRAEIIARSVDLAITVAGEGFEPP